MKEVIVVLDNGGQYCHLIATKVRNEHHVYSEIKQPDVDEKELLGAKGIILSGSPFSLYNENKPNFNPKILELGIPVLGICYGNYLVSHYLGGEVAPSEKKEYGSAILQKKKESVLLEGLENEEVVWMSHGDTIKSIPNGFAVIGSTENCEFAAIENEEKKIFGVQFHPEVVDTEKGNLVLGNFVKKICGCSGEWKISDYISEKIDSLKKEVGEKKVLLLVSGGVDSTVCASLLAKAIPLENLFCLHIDNGLMRKNESADVEKNLGDIPNFKLVDASQRFINRLENIFEPEQKRKIIGNTFIDVANDEIKNIGLEDWLLGQGTIYPDTIESGATKHADVIKTHHNRVDIIQEMIKEGKIVEPIKELYKEEVRELGEKLGLAEKFVWRHPFPGPGLGVRLLCSNGESENFEEIEKSLAEHKKEFEFKILPCKSVGVKGDERSYEHAVIISGEWEYKKLEKESTRIVNEVRGINRAVYLLPGQEIKSIELIKAYTTKERLAKLREADAIVMEELENAGLMRKVWQCPTVLAPVNFNGCGEAVILRPVYSTIAMTAKFADLPKEVVEKMKNRLLEIKGIGAVLFDITHKPPGTIEWE